MARTEVIAMAEQAGYPHVGLKWNDQEQAFLMRFAALVAAKEREACAQVCESWGGRDYEKCAAAIRERNSHVA